MMNRRVQAIVTLIRIAKPMDAKKTKIAIDDTNRPAFIDVVQLSRGLKENALIRLVRVNVTFSAKEITADLASGPCCIGVNFASHKIQEPGRVNHKVVKHTASVG